LLNQICERDIFVGTVKYYLDEKDISRLLSKLGTTAVWHYATDDREGAGQWAVPLPVT